jgi:hypothetical protein
MVEIADIFRQYGEVYRKQRSLPLVALKSMIAIESCRTSQLGGHVDECDECGHQKISYNSCRNRHCPKCQNLPKERWVEDRKGDLLPIPYFHVVFTLPAELHLLALQNKKEIYGLLLKASAETLQELASDPKHLGAQIGFISIVHTWGQNLMDHPHVHCIVTGGGLSPDQTKWVAAKPHYFLPVKVMSRLFRGKFLYGLKKLQSGNSLYGVETESTLHKLITPLYNKEWVVYCKPPFHGPEHVLTYLGRYTHKIAISNQRICKLAEGKVTFKWRDYSDHNQNKKMTLDAFEFIRRFLLHILPERFVKIRHYGILSNRNKETKLKCSKVLLGASITLNKKLEKKESWIEFLIRLTGEDPTICLTCKKGRMVTIQTLPPKCCSPPHSIDAA